MWRALLDAPGIPDDAFRDVDRISSGASALHPALWAEFKERFDIELQEGYGLTETSPTVASHIGIPVRPGTVGKVAPGVEVKVVDDDGNSVPHDDAGEILVRGPGVFLGYWENEEATKAVLDDDGWLHTRDIGVLSEDGYLALVDRAKDLIIVSGFNVYPFEVETVLVQHPNVHQTVVVGRDDERRGERVVAYITVPDGVDPPKLDELVDFCRERLARYKCPTELHVVDELPIAASGKTVRRKLS
jgi:long-chain acyl-CoA synthetase